MKKRRPGPRIPDSRQIAYARAIGLLFCLGGFAAIGLGWAGAARRDCVDCQVPFLLSGGAAGLGMIVFGGALLVMAQLRSDSRRIGARLDDVAAALVRSSGRDDAPGLPGDVIAGGSSYHRPDCRLLVGKTELEAISLDQARTRGLSPCRVCSPPDGPATDGQLDATPVTAAEPAEGSAG